MYEKRNEFDSTLKTYNSLNERLYDLKSKIPQKKCFLGFDGYIDSLYSMVKIRKSISEWTKMDSMKTYGEQVLNAVGSSTSIERVLKNRIHGGFAPNTCSAINSLGMGVCLTAACGFPQINDVFLPLTSKNTIETYSFCNPGETLALEFNDGKIMMQDFGNILEINWNLIKKRISIETIIQNLNNANIMGFGHWSLIPELNDIWIHLMEEIFPSIDNLSNKLFFVDLADIKKRTREDILAMLKILTQIDEEVPVLLTLNDQECLDIYKSLYKENSMNKDENKSDDLIIKTRLINDKLNISRVVTHTPHHAIMVTREEMQWITEGFTSNPKFMTGAGDHFNSGLVVGLACDLENSESLMVGNALTAIFVRSGSSPNFEQLSKFIYRYLDYINKDISDIL